jgi:hypothetical protein
MIWFILLIVVVGVFALWKLRVPILAKLLGQSQSRINRQIGKKR